MILDVYFLPCTRFSKDNMPPSTQTAEAGSPSRPGSNQQTSQPQPGFNNVHDNPFNIPQPPTTTPASRNPTASFCWCPFTRHIIPGGQHNDDVDGVLKTSNSRPFSPRHGRLRPRTTYRVASCSSRGLNNDDGDDVDNSPSQETDQDGFPSSQGSSRAGQNVFGGSSSSNKSSPITNPNSSQQRSASSTPATAARGRFRPNSDPQAFSDEEDAWEDENKEEGEESPLARRTMKIDRRFFVMDDNDDGDEESGFVNFQDPEYDDAFGGQADDFPEEPEPQRPRLAVPHDASACQRIMAQQDDEIADLRRRYALLEEEHQLCGSSRSAKARLRPRDERGRWVASGRVDKNKSNKGTKRGRRTELKMTLATASRFGYQVSGLPVVLPERQRTDVDGFLDGGSRVGRVITREIWEMRRAGGGARG